MLKYKQIWHEIKPIKWLIKFNLTILVTTWYMWESHTRKGQDTPVCKKKKYTFKYITKIIEGKKTRLKTT